MHMQQRLLLKVCRPLLNGSRNRFYPTPPPKRLFFSLHAGRSIASDIPYRRQSREIFVNSASEQTKTNFKIYGKDRPTMLETHEVFLSTEMPIDSNVIVPISMYNAYHQEKSFDDFCHYLKKYAQKRNIKLTILMTYGLQRKNGIEQAVIDSAREQFLDEHREVLAGLNVVLWDDFIEQRESIYKYNRTLVEKACASGTFLYDKCNRTAALTRVNVSTEISLEYQKTEYAAILSMHEFDFLVYPCPISPGISALYKIFLEVKIPRYNYAIIRKIKNEQKYLTNFTLPKESGRKKSNKPLPEFLTLLQQEICIFLHKSDIVSEEKAYVLDILNTVTTTFKPVLQTTKSFLSNETVRLLSNFRQACQSGQISEHHKYLFFEQVQSIAMEATADLFHSGFLNNIITTGKEDNAIISSSRLPLLLRSNSSSSFFQDRHCVNQMILCQRKFVTTTKTEESTIATP